MSDPASMPPTRKSGRGSRDAASTETTRDPPPGLPRIGEIVAGRYRIERVVGAGGMAHVLAARHVELGHGVALKVLDPSFEADAGAKARFAREARAMAALSSRHTVRVHDVGALATGLPFLVMELLEGSDLAEVLAERGPLPFDEACAYVEQACEAVDEAHEVGLIHRDLKPQNLFLARVHDGPPIVRVLDFGIARAVGGPMGKLQTLTRVGDVVGTLSYMAPEQIKSSRSVDRRADVWALGACLYRLVCGRRPFVASSEPALVEAILVAPPTPITAHRPDVPAVLVSVILRCLRKAPEERFPTARSLKSALAEARAIMAVEPLREAAEPAGASPARGARVDHGLPSERAIRAARATVDAATGPELAHTARASGRHETAASTTRPDGPVAAR
ncbi:MAG: serine/threonine protein kinase, partial [Labilithrix sp.]|nr:serine/threonine protein kinase [Labilithrix sp.]